MTVETARLLLRPYVASDWPAFWALHRQPGLTRYLPWEDRDEAAAREAFAKNVTRTDYAGDAGVLVLAGFLRETDQHAGEFLLIRRPGERTGEVGYILEPALAGRGLATEGAREMLRIGFEQLDLHRVIGRIDARNLASARVLEKAGLRREAHFVRNEWLKGEWCDEVVYAILADEWVRTPT